MMLMLILFGYRASIVIMIDTDMKA